MAEIERDEIITLNDEDGKERNFVVVDGVEYNGKDYLALVEEEHFDDDECEFTILRVDETEGDDCMLSSIENEDEFYKAPMHILNVLRAKSAYLYMLDYPLTHEYADKWECPERLSLVSSLEEGRCVAYKKRCSQ